MVQAGWWSFAPCKLKISGHEKYARLGLKPAASFVKMNLYSTLIEHTSPSDVADWIRIGKAEDVLNKLILKPELAFEKFQRVQ